MCLIPTRKLWWPTIFRLHQHRVSLVIQRKQNKKCMLGSFRLAVHSHFAFVSAPNEALLTLKSSPQGEFNTPAAFQWFSSHPFLLLFSSHSLMPRAPFGAEKCAKATPLKSFFCLYYHYFPSTMREVHPWSIHHHRAYIQFSPAHTNGSGSN